MGRVRCYDCGKLYNCREDGFCPHCGAFNQPPQTSRIGADGTVVRVDGLNEAGHKGSFTHREFHEEERERRRTGLDKSVPRGVKPRSMSSAIRQEGGHPYRRESERTANGGLVKIVVWVVAALLILNVLSRIIWFL